MDRLAPTRAMRPTARQRRRPGAENVKTKRTRRLLIDDKFKLGRLQHWKVSGLGALENVAGIDADLAEHVGKNRPVAHQEASFDHLARNITRGYSVAHRQCGELYSAAGKKAIARNEKGLRPFTHKSSESSVDLARGAGIEEK